MQFTLTMSKQHVSSNEIKKFETLGFEFETPIDLANSYFKNRHFQKDGTRTIEFETLDDLLAFSREWGDIIINATEATVEIYNSYRE